MHFIGPVERVENYLSSTSMTAVGRLFLKPGVQWSPVSVSENTSDNATKNVGDLAKVRLCHSIFLIKRPQSWNFA